MADLFISLCDVSTELIWQCGLVQMVESANLHSRESIKFGEPCNDRRDYWSWYPTAKQLARHICGGHLVECLHLKRSRNTEDLSHGSRDLP